MIDEIRVDTYRLRDHIESLYVEKARATELYERLEHVKRMIADEYHGDIAHTQEKAECIRNCLSEMAEAMVTVVDIFETLDKELSHIMQEHLDKARQV